MRNQHHILEAYRRADYEIRLNLFLECPTLRKAFIEIESREVAPEGVGMNRSRFWRRFFPNLGIL